MYMLVTVRRILRIDLAFVQKAVCVFSRCSRLVDEHHHAARFTSLLFPFLEVSFSRTVVEWATLGVQIAYVQYNVSH